MGKKTSNGIYALYKGEEQIAEGTLDQLVKITGIKRNTLNFYQTPAWKKRREKSKKGNYKMLVRVE